MQEATKRAAIYARIATAPQGAEPDPLRLQIATAKHYCSEKGYTVNESHMYQEVISGAGYKNHPKISALLESARQGAFDVLVVFALSRLSRNPADVAILIATFEGYGVQVESITEPEGDSSVDAVLSEMLTALNRQVTLLQKEANRRRRSQGHRRAEQGEKRT
jgi:site-specific DNA recombinase